MEIIDIIIQYIPLIIIIISIPITIFIIYKVIKKIKNKRPNKKLLFEDFNIGKYKIIMFRKIGDKYQEIERLKMEINQQKFRYHNKDFKTFDINKIAFSDKRFNFYAFDYDSGAQLTFKTKEMPDKITIEEVDVYVNRNIVEQIVKGLEDLKPKGQYLMLIIGVIMGVAIGIIIGIYIGPSFSTPTITNTPIPTFTPHPTQPPFYPSPISYIIEKIEGVIT